LVARCFPWSPSPVAGLPRSLVFGGAAVDPVSRGAKSTPGRLPHNGMGLASNGELSEDGCAKLGRPDPVRRGLMRADSKLTLLAAGLVAVSLLAPTTSSGAWAGERSNASPAPTGQQTSPPPTGGCPYRGGKLELIT
jgi:hypothetical protein